MIRSKNNNNNTNNRTTILWLKLLVFTVCAVAFQIGCDFYFYEFHQGKFNNYSIHQEEYLLRQSKISHSVSNIEQPKLKDSSVDSNAKSSNQSSKGNLDGYVHKVSSLSCEKFGGPDDEFAQEMIYWEDIASDSDYLSPFYDSNEIKYLTFEPDGGGWNNIRMAMETIIILAHSMGRVLVLPPEKRMYLIGKGDNNQKFKFTFNDFFHLDSIQLEHKGFNIITMEDFLKREAMQGSMINKNTGRVQFPPNNRTKWDGENLDPLWNYLRETAMVSNWKSTTCIAAFPLAPDTSNSTENLQKSLKIALDLARQIPDTRTFTQPLPVQANLSSRMHESLGGRSELCLYDDEMQASQFVHFMCSHKHGLRLLTHFYAFVFFENWKQDLWAKRFVRDHLRYKDEIFCAAARVVEGIRRRARLRDPTGNPLGEFDSLHVRRGDFQYKRTRISGEELLANIKNDLKPGSTVFIATDERDRSVFKPLLDQYDICFLSDFSNLIRGVNTNYQGMLDQIIASRGRIFFGTFYSTLSGYIFRMRGYFAAKRNFSPSWDGGLKNSFYFNPRNGDRKMEMMHYMPLRKLFFAREFPTSWFGIDSDIEH